MLDEKDLRAIAELMDAKLAKQKDEIMSEVDQKLDTKLTKQKDEILGEVNQKLAATEARLDAKMEQRITDAQSEIMRGVAALMEAEFRPQFSLLAEGQQTIRELLPPQEDWEIMDTRMSALEAMVKKLNREVTQLKKAQ